MPEREADERTALAALSTATANKAITDRAKALDADITRMRTQLNQTGPVLEANAQGSALARLFDLPDSKASFLSTWQNFGMAAIVELSIVLSLVAFEVLGAAETAGRPPSAKREAPRLQAREYLIEEEDEPKPIKTLPPIQKPRLVTSSAQPTGNVPAILAEVMEPGTAKDRIEIADIFMAYATKCRDQGKRPVSPEEFSGQLMRLCNTIGIETASKGENDYLLRVRLKAAASQGGAAS